MLTDALFVVNVVGVMNIKSSNKKFVFIASKNYLRVFVEAKHLRGNGKAKKRRCTIFRLPKS